MEMGRFEKRFVNSASHGRRVADHAVELLQTANPQPGLRLLDVGCGNGTALIHVAKTLRLAATGVDVDTEQIEAAAALSASAGDRAEIPMRQEEQVLAAHGHATPV